MSSLWGKYGKALLLHDQELFPTSFSALIHSLKGSHDLASCKV